MFFVSPIILNLLEINHLTYVAVFDCLVKVTSFNVVLDDLKGFGLLFLVNSKVVTTCGSACSNHFS